MTGCSRPQRLASTAATSQCVDSDRSAAFGSASPRADESKSPCRGLSGSDAAQVSSQHLPTRAHKDRTHRSVVGALVATDHRRGLGRVGRATHEAQERELVDGADLVRATSHRLGEDGGDRARAQRVAERLTRSEVRSKRHRGEELGQTERARRHRLIRAEHT